MHTSDIYWYAKEQFPIWETVGEVINTIREPFYSLSTCTVVFPECPIVKSSMHISVKRTNVVASAHLRALAIKQFFLNKLQIHDISHPSNNINTYTIRILNHVDLFSEASTRENLQRLHQNKINIDNSPL